MRGLSDYTSHEFQRDIKNDRIILFDIDDTLIHSTAHIRVLKNGKCIKKLNSREFNSYTLKPGEVLDYTEFDDYDILIKEKFTKYWDTLRREYDKCTKIGILTARGDRDMIYKFFKYHHIELDKSLIFAVGDPIFNLNHLPIHKKKSIIISNLINMGYKTLVFFDDNEKNLESIKRLGRTLNIKIITIKV